MSFLTCSVHIFVSILYPKKHPFTQPTFKSASCITRKIEHFIQRKKRFEAQFRIDIQFCKWMLFDTSMKMTLSVVPGLCTGCCGYHHWMFFVLPGKQEFKNYGIVQKHGPSSKYLPQIPNPTNSFTNLLWLFNDNVFSWCLLLFKRMSSFLILTDKK